MCARPVVGSVPSVRWHTYRAGLSGQCYSDYNPLVQQPVLFLLQAVEVLTLVLKQPNMLCHQQDTCSLLQVSHSTSSVVQEASNPIKISMDLTSIGYRTSQAAKLGL